ncbi:SGNH/GDSL hydrolase family protein [Paenibacillus sp. FSL M8-0228]|uniref:SGNH/GDSL hydrolase family protein n=1 Tax=Paenibacillus TaxID=44249 RepID=UPI00083DC478|nr:SGNH/GDSL hydrolase family protein [Paenibacillus polymyxa]ODB56964.1 hypothetical protein A7311_01155 [Paenibacillus polymyxa]
MSHGSKLIAEQYRNAELVKRSFGDVFYVAPSFGVFPGGTDVTSKLQAVVNQANAEGRTTIVMPSGEYKVTAISNDENIVYFGDGASFVGGYSKTINSLSSQLSITGQITDLENSKLDKNGTIIVPQISKNGGLIDQTYLTDELKQMIAGTAPINAVPADNSINYDKTTFLKAATNLFDTSKVVFGIVSSADGTIITHSGYYASDFIPVSYGNVYKTTAIADYAFYNASKVFVSGVENPLAPATINPPNSTVAFVRVTIPVSNLNTTMVSKGQLPSTYLPYGDYRVDIVDEGLREAINNSVNYRSKWTGKTWNAIGDSITEHNARTTKNYQDYIQGIIGCTVNNYGLSGTGWRTPSVSGGSDAIYQRMGSFTTDADLITVFAGTNDWAEVGIAFNMGTFGDTDPAVSFYGALDYTIKQLINKYPTKTIAVFTPIPREPAWALNNGVTLEQVADAIIKVANHYSVPVLDLYRTSNVYAWNEVYRNYALPDGLHPNDNGHMRLADKVLAFLNSL